ncbi:MAG TPA: hypothetical protein VMW11_10025 [Candidatus Dormibacteraeota bacterium]|nr:hypothetical protein [Candidatus Dormibacteraeota bacterium]
MRDSSKPEAAFVLLLLQALFWMAAGISAIPFAVGGEVFMLALAMGSLLLALGACLLGIGIVWRRRWPRRLAMGLEVLCLAGSLLLLALPVGANHGLVSWMVNVVLPAAVILLLRKPASEVRAFN